MKENTENFEANNQQEWPFEEITPEMFMKVLTRSFLVTAGKPERQQNYILEIEKLSGKKFFDAMAYFPNNNLELINFISNTLLQAFKKEFMDISIRIGPKLTQKMQEITKNLEKQAKENEYWIKKLGKEKAMSGIEHKNYEKSKKEKEKMLRNPHYIAYKNPKTITDKYLWHIIENQMKYLFKWIGTEGFKQKKDIPEQLKRKIKEKILKIAATDAKNYYKF